MYNINLMTYGRFTKEMHKRFNRAKTYSELDSTKKSLVNWLKYHTRQGVFNADEFTRLRFRISKEYIERLGTVEPDSIYYDTDSVKVVNS